MTLKTEHYVFGLIGIAAVAVFYYLWMENQAPSGVAAAVAAPDGTQSYPNVAPIQLGNVTIGATPSDQSYNVPLGDAALPSVQIGSAQSPCGCDDNDCESAGLPVTVQNIPDSVNQANIKNLQSFSQKMSLSATAPVTQAAMATGGGSLG